MIDPPAYRRLQPTLYRLEGIRCEGCGTMAIGAKLACADCGQRSLTKVHFAGRGHILAWTMPVKTPRAHGRQGPYPLALIELEEGPRVLAKLADTLSRPPIIGATVEVVFRRLFEPAAEELICYGYKFRAEWTSSESD